MLTLALSSAKVGLCYCISRSSFCGVVFPAGVVQRVAVAGVDCLVHLHRHAELQRGDLARCIMGVRRLISLNISSTIRIQPLGLVEIFRTRVDPVPSIRVSKTNIQLSSRSLFCMNFIESKILEASHLAHSPPRGNDIDSS